MACCLTKTGTIRHFTAPVGSEVTVKLQPNPANAEIVHIRYAKTELDKTPPFQFKVKAGINMLVVLVESPVPNVTLSLAEVCSGAPEQILDEEYPFDASNPARGYTIQGV